MKRILTAVSALALLTACGDGNPFFDESGNPVTTPVTTTGDTIGDGGGITTDGALPPGTDNPNVNDGIFRFESPDSASGGLVTEVSYNSAQDTFTVDNVGFDGANVYQRDSAVPTLNGTRIFAADEVTDDFLTGQQVGQIVPYRAMYGVSGRQVDGEPRTSFAIVRTGGYVPFGYGGYVYERNGGVVLPETGQATFSGKYAGMRVFDNRTGLEYTTGDMRLDIDFEDFNANDAVKGLISNRRAFDDQGNRIQLGTGEKDLKLPDIRWVIQEGATSLTANGEITSNVFSTLTNADGAEEEYETGTYTGIIAGDTISGYGGEVVGIIRIESADPRFGGVQAQETGGSILTR
ncbi:MAG: hypothetical protein KKB02_15970 [Alphaproteobacteria bacterium]|nr:hypothetical protein [Alphaproteobacteria bacterium]